MSTLDDVIDAACDSSTVIEIEFGAGGAAEASRALMVVHDQFGRSLLIEVTGSLEAGGTSAVVRAYDDGEPIGSIVLDSGDSTMVVLPPSRAD